MKAFEIPEWDSSVAVKRTSQEIVNKKQKKEKVIKGRVEKIKKSQKTKLQNEPKFIKLHKKIDSILEKKKSKIETKLKSKRNHAFLQIQDDSKNKLDKKRKRITEKLMKAKTVDLENNLQNKNDKQKVAQKSTNNNSNTLHDKKIKNKRSKIKKDNIPPPKSVSNISSKNKVFDKLTKPIKSSKNVVNTTRKLKKQIKQTKESFDKVPEIENSIPKVKSRKKPLTHQTLFFRKPKRNKKKKDGKTESSIKPSNFVKSAQVYSDSSGISKKTQQPLRERMIQKLKGARFRYLNERMYTNTGKDAKQYFDTDSEAFQAYHEGYRQQVAKWPLNPVDIMINKIKKLPHNRVIADFGCGDAKLAMSVPHTVHSFDLVAADEQVTACDMAHVPLKDDSVDVVVFCLSLMGTNLKDYLVEAKRVLKNNGLLKIAEVESRFENMDSFIANLRSYGFINSAKDVSHNLFCFLDFVKRKTKDTGYQNLPNVTLKPCLYKKR